MKMIWSQSLDKTIIGPDSGIHPYRIDTLNLSSLPIFRAHISSKLISSLGFISPPVRLHGFDARYCYTLCVATGGNGWVRMPPRSTDPSWYLRKTVDNCWVGIRVGHQPHHAGSIVALYCSQQITILNPFTCLSWRRWLYWITKTQSYIPGERSDYYQYIKNTHLPPGLE